MTYFLKSFFFLLFITTLTLINAQTSNLVKGEYLCEYTRHGTDVPADMASYTIWIVQKDQDSIYVFDSLMSNYWLAYGLTNSSIDTIYYKNYSSGNNYPDEEIKYFYNSDKISLYYSDQRYIPHSSPFFYTYKASGQKINSSYH